MCHIEKPLINTLICEKMFKYNGKNKVKYILEDLTGL